MGFHKCVNATKARGITRNAIDLRSFFGPAMWCFVSDINDSSLNVLKVLNMHWVRLDCTDNITEMGK